MPILTRFALIAFLLFCSFSQISCGFDDAPASEIPAETISRAVDKIMADMPVPGVLLGFWVEGRDPLIIARGVSDMQISKPMTSDRIFRIGSITKTFTAVTVLKLAEEKKLSLDDKLAKYESRIPNANSITLRQMKSRHESLILWG
ncbi:MAG: serine hydrolase domain-containing protein [Candidatus Ozemobacteraceae bacterium]